MSTPLKKWGFLKIIKTRFLQKFKSTIPWAFKRTHLFPLPELDNRLKYLNKLGTIVGNEEFEDYNTCFLLGSVHKL
jgi:hypothetical protein